MTENLYDHSIVEHATEADEAAAARYADAKGAHATAEAAHQEAHRVATRAIAGIGDPLAAERDVREAALRLSVGVKLRDHAAAQKAVTAEKLKVARAEAARPIAEAGFKGIYAASLKHDAAMAMLAEAEADRIEAVRVCMVGHHHGLDYIGNALDNIHAHSQQPAALRRAYMTGNHLNPDTGRFG